MPRHYEDHEQSPIQGRFKAFLVAGLGTISLVAW